MIWDNSQLSLDVFPLQFKKKKEKDWILKHSDILSIVGLFGEHSFFYSFLRLENDSFFESPSL